MSHPGGRPLKFKSVEELQEKIDAYFESCWIEENGKLIRIRPYTISGLALELDTCRKVLLDYEERDEYSNAIKKAKGKIESFAEEKLYGNNVAGVIFNLKNNYGWKDKTEQEHSNPDGNLKTIIINKSPHESDNQSISETD
ncbi:MAG: hypothetical protein GY861_18265 [bacterium]|nr:hypothetical protein [bacterium]